MLRQRVLSAVVLIPILFASIWFGGVWFLILASAAAILGVVEFDVLVVRRRFHPLVLFGALCALAFILNAHYAHDYCAESTYGTVVTGILAASVGLSLLLTVLLRRSLGETFVVWSWSLAGILYVGWLLSFWLLLMNSDLWVGRDWVLAGILATFGTDTSAYFVGRAFGRHKMAPTISPNKTWEGALGGLVGPVAVILIIAQFADLGLAYPKLVFVGLAVGVAAQLGDLAESQLKRSIGVKEASNLIPGHGGILDRLDSVVLTGVVVYYCLRWFVG
jgi:phosphatidate cytidylyltransferase